MSAASAMKRSAPQPNPHLIAALSLAILLGAAALAVLLFGDPRQAAPVAIAAVPPPAPVQIAAIPPAPPASAAVPARPLRGDLPGLDDPMLDVLADPPEGAHDVMLAGVAPIDEYAPVQTGAELAMAEAPAAAEPASAAGALPAAPLPGLTEEGPGGPLPVIGPDGWRPADAYRRPFADDGLPRIALIVGGLGWDPDSTRRAIAQLPPEVTLGFSPYAPGLQGWIDEARAAGHEVVIEIPMEPFDYPENDPGEHTLLTTAGAGANIGRLEWLMSRATGYFAVMNYLGERFLTSEASLTPVLSEIAGRGIDMVFDGPAAAPMERAGASAGLHWAGADRALDAQLSAAGVQGQLAQLESLALQNGAALGVGFAYPVVIDQAIAWTQEAERRGYALAPASAVLEFRAAARGR